MGVRSLPRRATSSADILAIALVDKSDTARAIAVLLGIRIIVIL
jgi:hypothetical protein